MAAFVLNLFLLIGFQEKKTCFKLLKKKSKFRGLPLLQNCRNVPDPSIWKVCGARKRGKLTQDLPERGAFNRFEFNRVSLVGYRSNRPMIGRVFCKKSGRAIKV